MDSPSAWQGWWPRAASSMALLRAHGWRKIAAALRLNARDATPMISLSPSPGAVGKAQTTSGQLLEHRIDIAAGHRAGSTRPSGQCGRPRRRGRPPRRHRPGHLRPGQPAGQGAARPAPGRAGHPARRPAAAPGQRDPPGHRLRAGGGGHAGPTLTKIRRRRVVAARLAAPSARMVPAPSTPRRVCFGLHACLTRVVLGPTHDRPRWGQFRLTWTAPRGATIGGHGDPWLFVWFLKSDQLAVTHAHSPLFSHELNVPGGVNLTWNTSEILPGVLLAGVTAWLGPVFTYNLLVTLALPLSAWAASLVFRRYVRSQLAAAVGGLLYGFSPYMVAHALGHLHLILAVTPPLLLALLDEVLVRQRAAPWLLVTPSLAGAGRSG